MTFFWASTESRNFSFDAFGETEADAQAAMALGLVSHASKVGMSAPERRDWLDSMLADMNTLEVRFGAAYIDGDRQL